MATGSSIFLIAVGAILTWAVTAEVAGVSLSAVGVILMIVGGLGLLASLFMADRLGHRDDRTVVREDRVVHDRF